MVGDLPYGRMCKASHKGRLLFGQKVIKSGGRALRKGGTLLLLIVGKEAALYFGRAAREAGLAPKRLGVVGEEEVGQLVVNVGGTRAVAFVYEKVEEA